MKIKYYFLLLFTCFSFSKIAVAQNFSFELSHPKGVVPVTYYYDNEKSVYTHLYGGIPIPLKKINDSTSVLTLKPTVVSFMQMQGTNIIVSPNDFSRGSLDAFDLFINSKDSIGPNYLLRKFDSGFASTRIKYKHGSTYNDFKNTFNSLTFFADSCNKALDEMLVKKSLNPFVVRALKENLMMNLAHYLIIPIRINNNLDIVDLIRTIENSVKINDPSLWLQTQNGHMFLDTYFTKLVVPSSKFNYTKSITNKFFSNDKIKKYVSYYYFDECLTNLIAPHSRETLLNELVKLKANNKFTESEQKSLNVLYNRIMSFRVSIIDDFVTQDLENLSGKKLSLSEKKALIGEDNIILDYWASWCAPCRAKMNEHNSSVATIGAKTYKIIFLSIDEERLNWLKAKYSFLNDTNCFRLIDHGQNLFVDKFKLSAIPRYFLIENGKLISDRFNY